MKHNVALGLILCLLGLLMLHNNNILIGLPSFLFGFYLMNKNRWKP